MLKKKRYDNLPPVFPHGFQIPHLILQMVKVQNQIPAPFLSLLEDTLIVGWSSIRGSLVLFLVWCGEGGVTT